MIEQIYKILQIGAIVFHFWIIYKRYASQQVTKRLTGNLGTIIQIFLCVFMIKELAHPFWEYKKWEWFIFDYVLALYFYLTYLKHYNPNGESYNSKV